MKKFFYFLSIVAVCLVSCSDPTPQQKAKDLMEQWVKNALVKPESYEFVDMKIDSCFYGTQYSPEAFRFAIELGQLYDKYNEYKRQAEREESTLAIFAPSYYDSAFEKQERKKATENLEKANRKKESAKTNILKLIKDNQDFFVASASGGGEFIGFYAAFQYRAETNNGYIVNTGDLFFFDKELNNIIAVYTEEQIQELSKLENVEDIIYEFESEVAELFSQE